MEHDSPTCLLAAHDGVEAVEPALFVPIDPLPRLETELMVSETSEPAGFIPNEHGSVGNAVAPTHLQATTVLLRQAPRALASPELVDISMGLALVLESRDPDKTIERALAGSGLTLRQLESELSALPMERHDAGEGQNVIAFEDGVDLELERRVLAVGDEADQPTDVLQRTEENIARVEDLDRSTLVSDLESNFVVLELHVVPDLGADGVLVTVGEEVSAPAPRGPTKPVSAPHPGRVRNRLQSNTGESEVPALPGRIEGFGRLFLGAPENEENGERDRRHDEPPWSSP
jgi:hypothetical protein